MRSLTPEQSRAVLAQDACLFIEAAPGSGKTTVAAERFAIQRHRHANRDHRAVMGVSFTRAATRELRERLHREWGRRILVWPHRVATLDALIADLVSGLLRQGLVSWPGGHTDLDVRDSWKSVVEPKWGNREIVLRLVGTTVTPVPIRRTDNASRPIPKNVLECLRAGVCTHEDVRGVLAGALQVSGLRQAVTTRLAATVNALIVDEVFDANDLDLAVIRIAADSGANVTLIGDPWQALYRFRGARPELVPALLATVQARTAPLTRSFRWTTSGQRQLASDLRNGSPVELARADTLSGMDVVLATHWKPLWLAPSNVLPLAFSSARWNIPEAGATLLLDFLTRSLFSTPAATRDDALATLRIDPYALDRLDGLWPAVVDTLRAPGSAALTAAYNAIVDTVATQSSTTFPKSRANYTERLGWLRDRLTARLDLVPGMTIHQAKGREWDRVGLVLTDDHVAQLGDGIGHAEATHRLLYVACTRARAHTFHVT